jgi:hypothetical protein
MNLSLRWFTVVDRQFDSFVVVVAWRQLLIAVTFRCVEIVRRDVGGYFWMKSWCKIRNARFP